MTIFEPSANKLLGQTAEELKRSKEFDERIFHKLLSIQNYATKKT